MTDETAGSGQPKGNQAENGQSENEQAGPAAGEQPSGTENVTPPPEAARRPPFPAVRLLYAIGFSVVAWFVFWITLILALAQFVVVAINGRVNEELKGFSVNLIQYLWELLAFITFVRDDQPFPIGPFPRQG